VFVAATAVLCIVVQHRITSFTC